MSRNSYRAIKRARKLKTRAVAPVAPVKAVPRKKAPAKKAPAKANKKTAKS
jgi:hypothetical protein